MQPDNIKKILNGTKTTTTRSEQQAKEINIPIGETAIVNIGGKNFNVANRGPQSIQEAGGRTQMEKSENFENNTPKYQQTKDWLNGKGKLYVYDIIPIKQTPFSVSGEQTKNKNTSIVWKEKDAPFEC